MKIGKLVCNVYGHPIKGDEKSCTYFHLILEDIDDIKRFKELYEPITAEKNINALFGFKSQSFRSTLMDYLVHEGRHTAPETTLLAMKLKFKETPTDLIEFCSMSDNIMNDKIQSFIKFVSQGNLIQINHKGGYCYVDNTDKYESKFVPTDKQIASFINYGKVDSESLDISSKAIIIENGEYVESTFLNKLYKHVKKEEIQVLNNFKTRTIGFKDKDYIEAFQKGIDKGMKVICFETTGQDYHNILKLHSLLMTIISMNPKIKFKVYMQTYDKKTSDLFESKNNLTVVKIEKYNK